MIITGDLFEFFVGSCVFLMLVVYWYFLKFFLVDHFWYKMYQEKRTLFSKFIEYLSKDI